MTVLGIDPGVSGGLALVGSGGSTAWKMPATERDVADLVLWIRDRHPGLVAVIEQVHAMPGQGVTSMFTFGRGYGFLRGVLVTLGIPIHDVTPLTWQKAMGCLSGGNKNVTKRRAQELWPDVKVTHSIADSLLIAEYGRRLHCGNRSGPTNGLELGPK